MMVTENTLCDGRAIRIDHSDLLHSSWGSAALCCDACVSIAVARDSWCNAFAMVPNHFENAGQYVEVPF